MIRPKLALILVAGLAFAPMASAQAVKPEDRNAALQYATTFYTANADMIKSATGVDMSKVGFDKAKLPDDFKAAAASIQANGDGAVGALLEASRLSKCDFELALEKGIGVLLPHLSKMRDSVRMLRVDARRHLLDGDVQGAAERIAAMARIGAHATNDHLLISSLVGVAMANAAADEAEAELGSGLLTAGAKESIAAGFKPLTGNDPFAVKAAIRSEQKVFTGWIMDRYRGADAGKRAAAELLGMMEGGGPSDAGKAIAPMNEQQLHAALELVNPYYELALAAWDAPDASERLKKLGERVEAGEFGPMAKILAPSLARARENDRKASERVATVVKRLASE